MRLLAGEDKMVKIGDGDLLEYYTLLIPEDSTVRIPVDVKGWKFDLDIKFDNTSEERGVDITKTDDGATLVFRKWDNSLGTALLKPHILATLQDGQKLAFMASNYAIGGTNKLDLQLLLQGV